MCGEFRRHSPLRTPRGDHTGSDLYFTDLTAFSSGPRRAVSYLLVLLFDTSPRHKDLTSRKASLDARHATSDPVHSSVRTTAYIDGAVEAVAKSIHEFGFQQPIVDAKGVIIVGHTRYKAALQLGLKKVPVHVAKGLTPAQVEGLSDCRQPDGHVLGIGTKTY